MSFRGSFRRAFEGMRRGGTVPTLAPAVYILLEINQPTRLIYNYDDAGAALLTDWFAACPEQGNLLVHAAALAEREQGLSTVTTSANAAPCRANFDVRLNVGGRTEAEVFELIRLFMDRARAVAPAGVVVRYSTLKPPSSSSNFPANMGFRGRVA